MDGQIRHAIYEFEGFRLDTRRRSLMVVAEQRCVPLKPKEYDTLLFFIERPGELLGKDTLMRGIWSETVVEENNLNQYVTALRRLLGDTRGLHRFIMNVRGRGYQFVPHVSRLSETAADSRPGPIETRVAPKKIDAAAWQCFQQAIFLTGMQNPRQWSAGADLLIHAVRRAPDFASAWGLLAQLRIRLMTAGWPAGQLDFAERDAARALRLGPNLAFAQMAAGAVAAARGRWIEAEERYRAAATLESDWPIAGDAHSGHVLLSAGHTRRALAHTRASQARAHGMIGIVLIHGLTLLQANRDAEANEALQLIATMGGQMHRPHFADLAARVAQRRGRLDDAVRVVQAGLASPIRAAGGDEVAESTLAGVADGREGPAVDAIDRLRGRLRAEQLTEPVRHRILSWYAELSALDRAYEFANATLDHFARERRVGITWSYLWLREMGEFRRDRRFEAFAARLGLTEYWTRFGPPDAA